MALKQALMPNPPHVVASKMTKPHESTTLVRRAHPVQCASAIVLFGARIHKETKCTPHCKQERCRTTLAHSTLFERKQALMTTEQRTETTTSGTEVQLIYSSAFQQTHNASPLAEVLIYAATPRVVKKRIQCHLICLATLAS